MRLSRTSTAAIAVLAAAALTPATAAVAVPNNNSSEKLRAAVSADGILEHLRALEAIADENGGNRASGTEGYDQSVEYVVSRLEAAGYDPEIQTFEFPFYQETAPAHLERTAPTPTTYTVNQDFATMEYSGSGDVTGTVQAVDINLVGDRASTSGCEASDFAGFTAGNIALVQRGTCTFTQKAANAEAAGASAVIVFNQGNDPTRTGLLQGTLGGPGITIPVVGTTFDIGADLAAAGTVVHVSTSTESEIRETYNVIAETRTGRTDQVLAVGAHLDSTLDGPAINDDGSGSATILEIAEQMAKVKPNNTVRFLWFGAEENGLLGSEYYVSQLSDAERAAIKAYLNFDMLGSTNFVRFVYDADNTTTPTPIPPQSKVVEDAFTSYFSSVGLASEQQPIGQNTDHYPFMEAGIPVGGITTGAGGIKTPEQQAIFGGVAGEPYDPNYHTPQDRVSNIDPVVLEQMADAAAHVIITFAYDLTGLGGADVPGKSHGNASERARVAGSIGTVPR